MHILGRLGFSFHVITQRLVGTRPGRDMALEAKKGTV